MKRIYDTIRLQSTDSTNNEAKRHKEHDNLTVITAFEQTAGRGQRGNSWYSTPGLNLTFSILIKWGQDSLPEVSAASQFDISRITTLALADFLEAKGVEAMIKWPNDIYVNDRKICGILIENTVSGDLLSSSIIGIGLNINESDFPEEIPTPTSLRLETGEEYCTESCLEEFIVYFDSRLSYAETPEGRTMLESLYLEHLYRKDEPHRYMDLRGSGAMFTGIIRGVSPTACLLVETEKGELQEFAFKEIAYIIH